MFIQLETITPEVAAKYLETNTSNRTVRKSLVSQYARDMTNGQWKLTHQGIAMNCDGRLLDGQHRLLAIIESGVAVQMLVARGVDSTNQLVMDDHAKRSASDALTLKRGERVTSTQVAIVRAAVELGAAWRATHRTKTELCELVEQFQGAMEFTSPFLLNPTRGVTAAPVWGAIALAWFYVDDLDRLQSFCQVLCGIEMATEEGDRSAQILREWLLRTGVRYASQRQEAFRKTQRAVVAFMRHQKIDKLYGTTTHYPWPLVEPVR